MAKFTHGKDFTIGTGPFSGSDLNTLIDSAIVLPGFIDDWGAAAPDVLDKLLINDVSAGGLAKCTIQDIFNIAALQDPAAATKGLRSLGSGATQAAPGNDSRFSATIAGSVGKLRLIGTLGLPANDTAAAPKDLNFGVTTILAANTVIDWDLSDVFYIDLSGSGATAKTYTHSNVRLGRSITIVFLTTGYTGTITIGTSWGTAPANTVGAAGHVYTLLNHPGGTVGVVKAV